MRCPWPGRGPARPPARHGRCVSAGRACACHWLRLQAWSWRAPRLTERQTAARRDPSESTCDCGARANNRCLIAGPAWPAQHVQGVCGGQFMARPGLAGSPPGVTSVRKHIPDVIDTAMDKGRPSPGCIMCGGHGHVFGMRNTCFRPGWRQRRPGLPVHHYTGSASVVHQCSSTTASAAPPRAHMRTCQCRPSGARAGRTSPEMNAGPRGDPWGCIVWGGMGWYGVVWGCIGCSVACHCPWRCPLSWSRQAASRRARAVP
jgi:hypothetical protein